MTLQQISDIVKYDKFVEKYKVEKLFTKSVLGDSLGYILRDIFYVTYTVNDLVNIVDANLKSEEEKYEAIREHYLNLLKEKFGDIALAYLSDVEGFKIGDIFIMRCKSVIVSEEAYTKVVEFYIK